MPIPQPPEMGPNVVARLENLRDRGTAVTSFWLTTLSVCDDPPSVPETGSISDRGLWT